MCILIGQSKCFIEVKMCISIGQNGGFVESVSSCFEMFHLFRVSKFRTRRNTFLCYYDRNHASYHRVYMTV